MATDRKTLLDVAKATDPDGMPAKIIEVLNETNEVLQDAPAYPSNAQMGNRVTLRSSLPSVDFTKINKGTPRSKSGTEQRVDTIGILDGASEVDVKMKMVLGDAAYNTHRWNEDQAFIESMSQTAALNIFYGDEKTNEAAFTGLAPRLNAIGSTTLSASKVVDAGGVGSDNTSLFVVDWGERAASLIYPQHSKAGLSTRNVGEQRVLDKDGNPFQADVTAYNWAIGLTARDPRRLGRVANIDVSDMANAGLDSYTGPHLIFRLIDLMSAMPPAGGNKRVIYSSIQSWSAFHKLAMAKSNLALTMDKYLGELTPHFQGYPIRRVDRISLAESRVV